MGMNIGADIDLLEVGDDVWVGSDVFVLTSSAAGFSSQRQFERQRVAVGSRVLLAERVVLQRCSVPDDTITGSITLVNKSPSRGSIIVGSPATVIQSNRGGDFERCYKHVCWDRAHTNAQSLHK